jgi:hypothetical protein
MSHLQNKIGRRWFNSPPRKSPRLSNMVDINRTMDMSQLRATIKRQKLQCCTKCKFSIFSRTLNGCIYSGFAPQRMVIEKRFLDLFHNA